MKIELNGFTYELTRPQLEALNAASMAHDGVFCMDRRSVPTEEKLTSMGLLDEDFALRDPEKRRATRDSILLDLRAAAEMAEAGKLEDAEEKAGNANYQLRVMNNTRLFLSETGYALVLKAYPIGAHLIPARFNHLLADMPSYKPASEPEAVPEAVAVAPAATPKAALLTKTEAQAIRSNSQVLDEAIAQVPAFFGLAAFPGDIFRIGRMQSYLGGSDRRTPILYTQRWDADRKQWLDFAFAKGTSELKCEIRPVDIVRAAKILHYTNPGQWLRTDTDMTIVHETREATATHPHGGVWWRTHQLLQQLGVAC